MPVGIPTPKSLTPPEFEDSDFFGFLEATVQAPPNEYIGLLPIRIDGRLVCPVGTCLTGLTNVPIAAAVTAYSRMIINEFKLIAIQQGLDIYYSDTDSLVVNGPLPPEVCDSAFS
jgi:hypothetical protein